MATIGSLNVNLRANSGKFVSEMDKAQRRIKGFGGVVTTLRGKLNGLGSSLGGLGGLATGFAGLFAVGKLGQLAKSIDDTQKFSDRIGVASERLQELHFAAGLAGVSVQNMNLGLQRMTRRVSEAAQGSGEAVKALQELGVDAEKLAVLSVDQQFKAIADAIQHVGSQTDRVRLAFKLFDSEGVALVNTMRNGSRGLDEMASEAHRLGLVVGDEAGKKVEQMNDSVSILMQSFETLAKNLVVLTSGPVTDLARGMTVIMRVVNALGKAMSAFWKGSVGAIIGFASLAAKALEKLGVDIQSTVSFLESAADELTRESLLDLENVFGGASESLQSIADVSIGASKGIHEVARQTDEAAKSMEKAAAAKEMMDKALHSDIERAIEEVKRIALTPNEMALDVIGQQEKRLSGILARGGQLITMDQQGLFNQAFEKLSVERAKLEKKIAEGTVPAMLAAPEYNPADLGELGPAYDNKAADVVRKFGQGIEKAADQVDATTKKLGMGAEVDTGLVDLGAWAQTGRTVEQQGLKEAKRGNELLQEINGTIKNVMTLA